MKWSGRWLITAMLLPAISAVAQDDDTPDLAFLEYLGSWQESDEEWLVVAEELIAPLEDTDEQEAEDNSDNAEQDDEDQDTE